MKENFTRMPLSGRGKPITCNYVVGGRSIYWGSIGFKVSDALITELLNNYFRENKWYPLGADMTNPMPGGLGEYLQLNYSSLTPRHASAIAAIMVEERLLKSRGSKPIELKKIE
jgi:hypothetical protein